MKRLTFIIAFTISLHLCHGQTDSIKIFNAKILKKGFYDSYKEFVDNEPSVPIGFSIIPLTKSKTDTTVIGAEYKLDDSTQFITGVWGFCDGANVYVNHTNSAFSKPKYWKLECIGQYPFFTFAHKDILAGPSVFGLLSALATISAPVQYDLVAINEKGKFRGPDIFLLKKWLKSKPDLLDSFSKKIEKYLVYENLLKKTDGIKEAETKIIK